ncbi:MAG: caspase family protein [Campylobacterota bacterium]|nr:caspase family protein [Campylobacterota bacterium]
MIKLFVIITLFTLSLSANNDRALKMMKTEQRVALVIGNSTYEHKRLSNLNNPINDAKAMKKTLQDLGFEVHYGENLSVRAMNKKVSKFSKSLRGGGVGLFFFAGHGIEAQGHNYLMGKDSNLDDKEDVSYESLQLSKVLDKMQNSGNRLNIVLLDACRNDPFSRSGGGGLAKSTAEGTFIAYATSPGDVADDGSGGNGAFTKEILKNITKEGLPIERVFKNVKVGVLDSTNNRQRPWTNSDITGDFFFKLGGKTQSSNYSFKSKAPSHFSLSINTQPKDAKVYITNIKPKYYDGIKLKKGTYSDWRLPNKNTLVKLYKNKNKLKNTSSNVYWSSTTDGKYKGSAWYVSFNYGFVYYSSNKGNSYYVRCVRGGQ